ncbi:MAG: Uma2 family endonuclease [Cyanobacteria bacterium CRU_2_1]|nr:Uma2 family endonuclease [Cyanobacteria bacterium RU_5_0]NJR58091.1 Uma2 family endonuclease [Cyanobacteria bacterium CRU_2_1]
MTQTKTRLTFEEYASLDAEDWVKLGLPEGRCEYVENGELFELPSESGINTRIAHYLFLLLVNAGIPFNLICLYACEVEVSGKPKTRYPDLVILREEHLSLTQKRLFIRLDMPNPQLVVEVVSPGSDNHRRDYTAKRMQYQERGIPEYWLLNPEPETIEVLELKDGQYVEFSRSQGTALIQSPSFKTLPFTAQQVFHL